MDTENVTQQDGEQIEAILLDVVHAQAGVPAGGNSKSLAQHLQEVTYPLIARLATFTKVTRDAFDEAAAAFGEAEETMSRENSDFLHGYVDAVFSFVQKYIPGAQQNATAGDDELLKELRSLYEGGKAVKQILNDMSVQEDEDDQEEEE